MATGIKWDTPEKAFDYFFGKWDEGVIDDDYIRILAGLLEQLYGDERRYEDESVLSLEKLADIANILGHVHQRRTATCCTLKHTSKN